MISQKPNATRSCHTVPPHYAKKIDEEQNSNYETLHQKTRLQEKAEKPKELFKNIVKGTTRSSDLKRDRINVSPNS